MPSFLTYPMGYLDVSANGIEAELSLAPLQVEFEAAATVTNPANVGISLAPLQVDAEATAVDNIISGSLSIAPLQVNAEGAASVPSDTGISLAPFQIEALLGEDGILAEVSLAPIQVEFEAAAVAGPPFAIPTTTNLVFFGDADSSENTINGSNLEVLHDWSTQEEDFTVTANYPTVSGTTYNGLSAIEFDGSQLTSSYSGASSASSTWTIILVCKTDADSVWVSSSFNAQARVAFGGNQEMSFFDGTTNYVSSTLGTPTSQMSTYVWLYEASTTLKMYQNGTKYYDSAPNAVNMSWNLLLGWVLGFSVEPDGDFMTLLLFDDIQSASNLNTILGNIKTRMGTSIPAQETVT